MKSCSFRFVPINKCSQSAQVKKKKKEKEEKEKRTNQFYFFLFLKNYKIFQNQAKNISKMNSLEQQTIKYIVFFFF